MFTILFRRPDPCSEELHRRSSLLWLTNLWLPAVLAVLLVFIESTPTFSARNTTGWLRPVFEHILGPLGNETWETIHMFIRKGSHFIGYALVCLAFLRAWLLLFASDATLSLAAWRTRCCLAAVVSTFLVASGDELHQSFLPSRTGRFSDVLLDTVGASSLCLLIWLARWRRS